MAAADQGRLTPQQARAIGEQSVSVGLSAGAGCGKTFVLTERFLAALAPDPAGAPIAEDLRRLVAITFTERAAREMRARVRAACHQRLLDAPPEQAAAWLELVRQLDMARISTIHSFCTTLLRTHAIEAGLDPQFALLSAAQADTLLLEQIQEELHRRLIEQDAGVLDLAAGLGLQRLPDLVRQMYRCRQEIDWEQWLAVTPEDLVARWQTGFQEEVLPRMVRAIGRSEPARRLLAIIAGAASSHPVMLDRCRRLAECLPRLQGIADLDAIHECARVQGGGKATDWPDPQAYADFKAAAEQLRTAIDKCRKSGQFDAQAALPAAQLALRLLAVTRAIHEQYEARKQELSVLDFDDLLLRTRQLLRGPQGKSICQSLAAPLRLLLVDEFQDTDPVQIEIVEALCGNELTRGKLFFVGDSKQSIYRFRGADPHVFRRLRETLPAEGRLPLTKNFRSQPAILDFVNALFATALGSDYEPLEAQRGQVTPLPAVEFLWAPADATAVDGEDVGTLRRREAQWIARRLRSMFDAREEIVSEASAAQPGRPARRLKPGDVAILFRALSDVACYEEALREYGIDYYLVGGHAFYAQQEVFDLLNLLRAVEHPHDELSLAGVLRSGFFNLADETLFWLAQHAQGLSGGLFADRLPRHVNRPQRERVSFAAAVLKQLRAMKDSVPIAQLIHEALARTGYDALLVAEFLGPRKLANLHKLIEQARQFDASGIFGLSDFITQLAEFVARQPDEPLAASSSETSDVVRLMTIHQAKGLEFPLVVVPDLDRPTRRTTQSAAFTRQWGPVVRTAETSGFELYAYAESEEDAAELVRLFYVATTRAADYLILSSGVTAIGTCKGPWLELLAERFDLQTGALRVPLPAGYAVPQIRVIASEPAAEKPQGTAVRRDLAKLAQAAVELAVKDGGHVPPHLAPIAADTAARRQFSFSRLSGLLHAWPAATLPSEDDPPAAAEPSIDPLGLGTLVHAVLAEVDWALADEAALVHLIRRHAQRHVPNSPQAEAEAAAMLGRLLQSPRGAEIRTAAEVHRELEFLLAWPPGEMSLHLSRPTSGRCPERGPAGTGAEVYFQGFLDCLYRDAAGDWHLVDYKTNQVTDHTLPSVAAGYELQMFLYALTAEQVLGHMPVEVVLCFLRTGQEHRFTWTAAARQELAGQVSQAVRNSQAVPPTASPTRPIAHASDPLAS